MTLSCLRSYSNLTSSLRPPSHLRLVSPIFCLVLPGYMKASVSQHWGPYFLQAGCSVPYILSVNLPTMFTKEKTGAQLHHTTCSRSWGCKGADQDFVLPETILFSTPNILKVGSLEPQHHPHLGICRNISSQAPLQNQKLWGLAYTHTKTKMQEGLWFWYSPNWA